MVESTQIQEHAGAHGDAATEHPHGIQGHPSNSQYVSVFLALAVLTSLEVAIYYMDLNTITLVTGLLIFAACKFALVVAFFMHLRFDNRLFTSFFVGGLVMAVAAFLAVLTMFRVF